LRHITGDKSKFAKLELKDEGFVTYGENYKGRILGSGVISNEASLNIHNVFLVEGLKHNLINQRHKIADETTLGPHATQGLSPIKGPITRCMLTKIQMGFSQDGQNHHGL